MLLPVQVLYDGADYGEGVFVVLGEVVGDARAAGMDPGAAELFRGYLLSGCSLDQRRAAEEDRTRPLDYYYLVAHRGNVGPSGRTTPHYRGDLGYTLRAHLCLVVEDAPEVLAIG